jgi:hypothetical protein
MEKKKIAVLVAPAILVLTLSAGFRVAAQEPAPQAPKQLKASDHSILYDDSQPVQDQGLQLLRKDLRSQKKQIIAANMDLTDTEAEKFWPVYDQYATELAKTYDTKISLIGDYLGNYKTMTGDDAESYIRKRAAIEEEVNQLRLKYVPAFRKVLSGRQTALLFQIEYRLDLLINLQLSQTPVIEP